MTQAQVHKARIQVEVEDKGMFPTERVIVARDFKGAEVASYVPETVIEQHGDIQTVDVEVLGAQDDLVMIMLPGEPAGPGNTILTVPANLLLSTV